VLSCAGTLERTTPEVIVNTTALRTKLARLDALGFDTRSARKTLNEARTAGTLSPKVIAHAERQADVRLRALGCVPAATTTGAQIAQRLAERQRTGKAAPAKRAPRGKPSLGYVSPAFAATLSSDSILLRHAR
jgi:hypothetical protein